MCRRSKLVRILSKSDGVAGFLATACCLVAGKGSLWLGFCYDFVGYTYTIKFANTSPFFPAAGWIAAVPTD